MNHLLRPRIWASFSPSCRLYEREAGRPWLPSGKPIFFAAAGLRSVLQAGSQFHGLMTAIHGTFGLDRSKMPSILLDRANSQPSALALLIRAGPIVGRNFAWPLVQVVQRNEKMRLS